MTVFFSPTGSLPEIPDNLSIPQFFLDTQHSSRPIRKNHVPCLIDDKSGRQVFFNDLQVRVRDVANGMNSVFGIGDEDVVCIISPNDMDYPVLVWAIQRLGGVVTTSNPQYTVSELIHQLRITKAKLIFAHPDCLAVTREAAAQCGLAVDRIVLISSTVTSGPSSNVTVDQLARIGEGRPDVTAERHLAPGEAKNKLAFLSFSSGTTGQAKAVAISHYAVISNIIQMAIHNKILDPVQGKRFNNGGRATAVLPFFHIYGLVVNIHFLMYTGLPLVVFPKFQFVPFLESICRHQITHLYVVPPQIVLFCKHPAVQKFDLRHIRFAMSGAAPLSLQTLEQFKNVVPNCCVGQGYGMTETAATISMIPPSQSVGTQGSAGQIIPGVVCRVVRPDGSLAGVGELGELQVSSPSNASFYLNNPDATRETFLDGHWVRTGDEVRIDKNGEIFIVDRIKEIMKVRGYQVAPAELEGHLLTHPDVANACVVSVLDDYSGELPKAYIVLNEKAAQRVKDDPMETPRLIEAIAKLVADHKSAYKHLKGGIELIDSIPTSSSGKALRRILRDHARASAAPARAKL